MTRRIRRAALRLPFGRWHFVRGNCSILIAPPDLRTADPTIADDLYAGRFVFVGQAVETGGRSPFKLVPPTPEWARELHRFGWLRHLRAADTPLAAAQARVLVADWLKVHRKPRGLPWEPEVAARRAMSFLAQARIILEGADHDLYRRFVRALERHGWYLRAAFGSVDPGLPRLRVAIALALIGLSLTRQDRLKRAGLDRLDAELKAQVLPDGGHVTRNPRMLVDALVDLLPLRQALIARGQTPSPVLLGAIDRMMPMLRFFRHGDGAFARFNGMGSTPTDLTATVLAYDETQGSPVLSAEYSGYERVEAGRSLLIVDAGPPPPLPLSRNAHAGTLSFEFSTGPHRLVINCGAPAARYHDLRRAARTTAAHSTVTIDDLSSSRFASSDPDAAIVSGPRRVERARGIDEDGAIRVELAHDGYLDLGLRHERTLVLSADGSRLSGEDRVTGPGSGGPHHFAARFHLHPSLKLEPAGEGATDLVLPGGARWRFSADQPFDQEESVYLSDVYGTRRTLQIVVAGELPETPGVRWSLTRID